MSITVVCHRCGTLTDAPESSAGKQYKCGHCGNAIQVAGSAGQSCSVCQVYVSPTEGVRDAAGSLYCAKCQATNRPPEDEVVSVGQTGAAGGPGPSGELAACVVCRAITARMNLCNFDGQLVCSKCAIEAGLGTMSYRIKKLRRGAGAIIYRCPKCKGELESSLDEAGKEDGCPRCGQLFDVPGRYESFKAANTARADDSAKTASVRAVRGIPSGEKKWIVMGAILGFAVLVLVVAVLFLLMREGKSSAIAKPATAGAASATQNGVAKAPKAKAAATTQPRTTAAARAAAMAKAKAAAAAAKLAAAMAAMAKAKAAVAAAHANARKAAALAAKARASAENAAGGGGTAAAAASTPADQQGRKAALPQPEPN